MNYQAYRVAPAPNEREFDYLMREYEYTSVLDQDSEHVRDPAFIYGVRAWLRLLGGFAEGGVDAMRLQQMVPVPQRFEYDVAATVTAVAPLLEMALARSSGPLRPVATVSTADLLGFGWESTAVQLGDRASRLQDAGSDKAAAFREMIVSRFTAMAPFFPAADRKSTVTAAQADRLQFIAAPRFPTPRMPEGGVPDARLRRCWLWKDGGAPSIMEMIEKGAADGAITTAIERMMREGGQLAIASLVGLRADRRLAEKLDALGIEPRLIEALPSAYSARAWVIQRRFQQDRDAFRKAQALEQLDWRYAVGGNGWTIFEAYLETNALISARRYGSRVHLLDPLNQLEGPRFTRAWIDGDDAAMRALSDAIARNSYGGPMAAVLHALTRGDDATAKTILEGATDKAQWWSAVAEKLRNFLPLLPALRDPTHADRARALDGFSASRHSAFPQWVLLQKTGLTGEDAVRFLGGKNAPPENQMLIAAVRSDARRFEELYKEHAGEHAIYVDPDARPLIYHLRCQLLAIAPPREEPDLMPGSVRSLEERIHEPLDLDTDEAKIAKARTMAETFDLPDAEPDARIEAAFQISRNYANAPSEALTDTLRAPAAALLRVIEDYPSHPRAGEAAEFCVYLLDQFTPPDAQALFEKLAAHSNARVSEVGIEALQRRGQLGVVASKPVEFKFTGVDGREVDLAKLRGKVVLLDFWASWCGPCIAEMPHVVAAYEKYHARGFEIVGISLDGKKAALEAAARKHRLPWSQFFGGEREDIDGFSDPLAKRLGLVGIPYECLLDKRGMLRHTGLRGERLAEAIERLLAE